MSSRQALLLISLILFGCSQPARPPGIPRVAVLPFENLSGDASLQWLAEAATHVIVWQQAPSPNLLVTNVRNSAGAVDVQATQVLRGTIAREKAGRIRIDTWLEDRATRRQVQQLTQHIRADATLFPALTQIAASLGAPPRPYATASVDALRALLQARASATTDLAATRERFNAALAADPAYAVAHVSRIEYDFARRDLDGVRQALADFRRQAPAAAPGETAEANQVEAALSGDARAVARALQALAAARPANSALQLQAADQAWRLLPAQDAVRAWERLLRIEPVNANALRMLAYSQAALRDFAAARTLLTAASKADPADLNNLDSRAEIEYQAGQFAEAARLFTSLAATKAPTPAGQPYVDAAATKAAYALLLAGDPAQAAMMEKGLAARKLPAPLLAAFQATWLFESGHRAEAIAKLQSAARQAEAGVRNAYAAQECLLHAGASDWPQAAAAAARAGAQGAFCGFLAQPPAAEAEWIARANQRFPGPQLAPLRQRVLGYAFALRGHCAAAIAPLNAAAQDPALRDVTELRLLLARCHTELRQPQEARDALAVLPVPPTLEPLASPLVFPAQFRWLADLALLLNRPDEARRYEAIHQRLAR